MKINHKEEHNTKIKEQFTQQAIPFCTIPGHYDSIQLLQKFSCVSNKDKVLDVACGPGLVAIEFANQAKHVTGLDLTQAMLNQAQVNQQKKDLNNISWTLGDAYALPFPDNYFSLVYTRYSFHHFLAPSEVLEEMIRVCKPGGRVMVADVEVFEKCSELYDKMELLRDHSHSHALTDQEFSELMKNSGLKKLNKTAYIVGLKLVDQLKASFTAPESEDLIKEMIITDIGQNKIGINATMNKGEISYSVPIAVYMGEKLT